MADKILLERSLPVSPGGPKADSAAAPGADAGGLSALLLLAPPADGPVLFVISADRGFIGLDGTGRGLRQVRLSPRALPVATGALAAVVVDFDSRGVGQRLREDALGEIARVLAPGGRCVVVAADRRIPRDRRDWRRYHLARPARRWSKLLASHGELVPARAGFVRTDRDRIVQLMGPDASALGRSGCGADRHVTVLRRRGQADERTVLGALVAQVQQALEPSRSPVRVEAVLVRKIGKTTVIAAHGVERRYVIRVPRSPMAEERGFRNFTALTAVHTNDRLSDRVKALVPRPRFEGVVGGYRYYVEDALSGTPRDQFGGWPLLEGWEAGSLEFVSDLHSATKRSVRIDRDTFDRVVSRPLERIRRRCSPAAQPALERLALALDRTLTGQTLPMVWSHGDFAAGNCLYDPARRLSAVVDWELFSDCELPVLDVLHCLEIPDEPAHGEGWRRLDLVREVLRPERAMRTPGLAAYIEQVGVPPHLLPALGLMYWIGHVSQRIDGRFDDARWMARRVVGPLESLAKDELR